MCKKNKRRNNILNKKQLNCEKYDIKWLGNAITKDNNTNLSNERQSRVSNGEK